MKYLLIILLLFSFVMPVKAQEEEPPVVDGYTVLCYGMVFMWCQEEIQTRLCMRMEKENCDLGVYDDAIQIIHPEQLDK